MSSEPFCNIRNTPPEDSPWKRRPSPQYDSRAATIVKYKRHGLVDPFAYQTPRNTDLSIDTKKVALLVSSSVVALVASIDGKSVFSACGTIIECVQQSQDTFLSTILTSASLLTSTSTSTSPLEVQVKLFDHRVYEGSVYACDQHFNLAFIRVHTPTALPVASTRMIDDSIDIDPSSIRSNGKKSSLQPHLNNFIIYPGQSVMAMGRSSKALSLMIAPGELSSDYCNFDCKELIRTSCLITKCGVGGPLVNNHGEVIGMIFYDEICTPFLPINIALKCLQYFNNYRRFCRPAVGMESANLYVASPSILEHVIHNFPGIRKGVIVEKIARGSPAKSCGLIKDDIIIRADGNVVSGFLQFFGSLMEKVGTTTELTVIRKGVSGYLLLKLEIHETDRLNSWPLPRECYESRQV